MTDKELLQLVEWLTSEDNPKTPKETLSLIYRIVHSHSKDACCNKVHNDWRDEALKLLTELKKLGEL